MRTVRRAYHLFSARPGAQRSASKLPGPAHPRQYDVGIEHYERPGLELQADDARVVAVRQSGEERPLGQPALARQAVLVAAGEVGVGEVDVMELVRERGVRAHQVHLARPDVAGVEGDVSQTEEVLGQVAAPVASDAEDAARPRSAACSRPRPRRPARAPRAGGRRPSAPAACPVAAGAPRRRVSWHRGRGGPSGPGSFRERGSRRRGAVADARARMGRSCICAR